MEAVKSFINVNDTVEAHVHGKTGAKGEVAADAPQAPLDAAAAFDDKLARQMDGRSSIIAGSLELIGLDDVRNIMGDAWRPIAMRVSEVALQELQRCLDPDDIFRPHGEASFLIHFDGLDKIAAERKAQHSALRIKAALIEQVPEIAEAISIRHFVVDLEPSSLQEEGRSLSDTLFERLVKMCKDAEMFLQRDRKSLMKDFQVQFLPVWHTQKQVTLFNRCLLNTTYGGTSLSQFLDLADRDEVAATYAELDYLTLTQSLEALHRFVQAGRSAMVLIPVNFSTILDEANVAEYIKLLATTPVAYKKFVIIEIRAVAISHPATSLLQIAKLLERYAKYVAVELPLEDPRLEAIVSGGPWAISLNLAGVNSLNQQLAMQLRQFTGAANAAAVNTLASGANSIGLAVAATEAGFTFVDGPAIHLPMREPRPPLTLRPLPRKSKTGNVRP